MSLWSAFTNLFSKETVSEETYASEAGEAQIALSVELAPNAMWRKLARRWRKALQRYPNSSRILNNLGVAYEQRGLFRAAGESYRKALELAPDDAYIRRNYELFWKAAQERSR